MLFKKPVLTLQGAQGTRKWMPGRHPSTGSTDELRFLQLLAATLQSGTLREVLGAPEVLEGQLKWDKWPTDKGNCWNRS